MTDVFKTLIASWSIDFYAGWSIMDIFNIFLILTVVSMVFNYFFDTAKR
jgi:hypothetical protein